MRVRYVHESTDVVKQSANIMWEGRWPMKAGKFPPDHPCLPDADALQRFRERGYWANPFPEGDGITMDAKGRPATQVVADIRECFGWEVGNYS